MGAATEMALSAANDENVNTSPRSAGTRSRQHSTNSLFAKPFDSPVKRLLLQNDHSKRSPTKSGAARGAPGAPDHLLAGRSSPLAPVRTNVRTSAQQLSDVSTILDSPSLSTPSRAGSKTDGLGLHWDVSVDDRTFTSTSETRLDTTRSSHDSRSESKNQLSLSTQDLSVPDLRDPEFSPLDSHFLLSPFTMSEPNFNKASPVVSTQGDKASPTSLLSHAASPVANASSPINNATATPTSPPRQAFFKGGSTGSFSRFPTPDKLALGFTPSPGQAANEVPIDLLLPPISPSGPILHEAGSLLRSTSSQTLQSESSSTGSLISSSSNSALSDILDVNPTAAPLPDIATTSRSRKTSASTSGRRSGLSRSDIRESLLSFPSPPTSPRPGFSFAKAADTLLPASKAPDSVASPGRSLSAGPSRTRESTVEGYGTDELQASIDELLSAAGIGSLVRSPEQSSSLSPPVAPALRASSLPPTDAHPYLLTRSQPSLSLPPNMALPPLPPLSKLSLGQGGSPPSGTPRTEVQPAAIAPRNTLPLRSASQQSRQPATGASPAAAEPVRREAPVTQPNAPVRTLRNVKSTESFLAAKSRQMAPAERFPLPKLGLHMTVMPEEPKQVRRRRTSLSIKIPKMFSKGKKHGEEVFPQSTMSQDGLQIPQSRFSPDSDAPTPISERAPIGIFKRLSRAASSPNLKASASESLPRQTPRKESHFVAPASAPPVPTTFTAAPSQADSSTGTPLPTPSLVTDVDSSMGGEDSPRVGASAENESAFARMQSHNPYFASLPTTTASQPSSPAANMQDARSPMSPDGKDWLHTPPITHPQRTSSLKGTELQNKPASTLASSGSYQSDSGSASMSAENASDIPSATQSARPSATRRSTTSGSSEDDDEEEEEDEYGGKSASSHDYYTSSDDDDNDDDEESEEDDLPLAQTHPDALKVQSSLRAKVRDQAKKKKRIDKTGIPKTKSARPISRQLAAQEQLRPDGSVVSAMTAPQTASLAVVRDASVRSKTAVPPPRNPFGFAPDELSEKLRKLDASHGRLNSLRMPPKRPESAGERPHDLLLPQTDEHVQHRSRSRGRADLAPPLVPFVQDSVLTMSEGSDHEATAPLRIKKKTQTSRPAAPTAPIAQALARQSSSVASSSPASPRSPAMPQQDHSFSALHAESVQSMSHHPHHHHHGRPAFLSRQRVYINDPQHHCSVDIDENMTASMLLARLRAKQAISANPAWTVTEVWRAMGVERPLREYELLQESIESWATEPNSSLLLVKKSPLAPLLSSLSKSRVDVETTAGWVQLETKRGKWSKRYIEIRGEALYIGKSEKQRDQTLLCHFSNFDAYIVPQACIVKMKTPKPYAFAVKSVDKVSLFENADQDYIHFFCVKTEAERDMWIQHILESRSKLVKQLVASRAAAQGGDTRLNLVGQQMLHQASHHVAPPHGMPAPSNTSSSVSRSGSNKSNQTPPMPSQAVFGDNGMVARNSSNARPTVDTKKIISADNLPPLPGAVPNGTFATIPQGRDWERLGPEDKRAAIHEAARMARTEGKALLNFGQMPEGAGLLGRARAKSIGQRR